jgi:Ion channel
MRGLTVIWPILSGLIALKLSLGAAVGLIERWGVGKGIYFAVITGLTIGYGDLVPTGALTRVLAVAIGLCGIVITALVAALAVEALRSATAEPRTPAGLENQRRE